MKKKKVLTPNLRLSLLPRAVPLHRRGFGTASATCGTSAGIARLVGWEKVDHPDN